MPSSFVFVCMFVVLSTKSPCLKRVSPTALCFIPQWLSVPHSTLLSRDGQFLFGRFWLTGSVMIRNVWGKDSFWRALYSALLCVTPLRCSALSAFRGGHFWFSSFCPDCKCLWVRDLASSASLSILSIPSKGVFTWYCSMSVQWRNQHMLPRWEGKESVKLKLVHQK